MLFFKKFKFFLKFLLKFILDFFVSLILKKEGYIAGYKFINDSKEKNNLSVNLKYENGSPVIKEIKRISKPGRRIYARADSIPRIQNGLGLAIVSTSKGVMSDYEAKNNNVGGEIICKVF